MKKDMTLRWKSIQAVHKRIESFMDGYRQNIALLGDDTDQISYALAEYIGSHPPKEAVCIYINISYAGCVEIFKNTAYSILSEYLVSCENLDYLISAASHTLPETTGFIKENLKKKQTASFTTVLELINKFITETSRRCLLIVENFTYLSRLFKNFHHAFSQFIIFQKKCMLIITSAEKEQAERLLSSDLNLLFGNFERISLNAVTFLDSYLYLKERLKHLPLPATFLPFFVDILGMNILYHDIMARFIAEEHDHHGPNAEITVLTEALYHKESYFYRKFMGEIRLIKEKNREYDILIRILLALSDGYNKKQEISSLGICDQKRLVQKIKTLALMGIVSILGDIYCIKDDLFSFWLSHVFRFEFYPSVLNPQKRYRLFRLRCQETLEVFKESFFKENTKRILELICSFRNESLRFGRMSLRMPHIEKTKLITYPERQLSFLIGEGKEIIFVGIKESSTDDNDILEYIDKIQSLKGKNIRRIFITLDSFTASAKLIAEQNKLITWDAHQINALCKAYGKPIMINENPGRF